MSQTEQEKLITALKDTIEKLKLKLIQEHLAWEAFKSQLASLPRHDLVSEEIQKELDDQNEFIDMIEEERENIVERILFILEQL